METDPQAGLKEDKKTYWLLIVAVLILVIIGEAWYIWNLQNTIKSTFAGQPAVSNLENLISVKGVIRTSGLSEAEKQQVGLSDVSYQITNIEDTTQFETHGYFLQGDKAEPLLGKCVKIIGSLPADWTEEKTQDNYDLRHFIAEYHRQILIPTKIEQLDYSSCHLYRDQDLDDEIQLRGTIVRHQRQSPFIDDDYEFKLINLPLSNLGFENIPQNFQLIIKPAQNSVWPELEEQLDKEVVIFGYVNKSGYTPGASLGHFMVTEIRPLISNRDLPASILPDQVVSTYTFSDIDFALYQKGNMNVPLTKSNDKSGILYANKDDLTWKEFSEIKELANSKNNPYILDYRAGAYYALIVDANGGGSGEGIAKLMSLSPNQTVWKLVSCFYYGNIEFDWSQVPAVGLPETVNSYLAANPDRKSRAPNCSNFQLIQAN